MTISKSELIKRYGSVQNLETLVSPAASDADSADASDANSAEEYQKTLMAHLADWYEDGGYFLENGEVRDALGKKVRIKVAEDATVACDQYKAAYYRFKASKRLPDEKEAPSSTGSTQKLYNALGSYTLFRICVLGFYLIIRTAIEWPTGPFSAVANQVLHGVIGLAGLSFGLELLIDSAMLLKSVLSPQGAVEKQLPWYKRLFNAFSKGNRPARMVNAAIWFSINLACFIATGGFSLPVTLVSAAIANLTGFGLDVLHNVYRNTMEIDRLEKLQKNVTDRIDELSNKTDKTNEDRAELKWLNNRTTLLVDQKNQASADRFRGIVGTSVFLTAGVALFMATYIGLGLITAIAAEVAYPILIVAGIGYLLGGLIFADRKWGLMDKLKGKKQGGNNSTNPSTDSPSFIGSMAKVRDKINASETIEQEPLLSKKQLSKKQSCAKLFDQSGGVENATVESVVSAQSSWCLIS